MKHLGKAENELWSKCFLVPQNNRLRHIHIIAHSTIWFELEDQRATHPMQQQNHADSLHHMYKRVWAQDCGDDSHCTCNQLYLTITNLGVVSAHRWFVFVAVACSPNPRWPSVQTLREQGSGLCTPGGRVRQVMKWLPPINFTHVHTSLLYILSSLELKSSDPYWAKYWMRTWKRIS